MITRLQQTLFLFIFSLLITGAFLVFAPTVDAQACNGICIDVNASGGSGGGGSSSNDFVYPTNLSLNINNGSACTNSTSVILEITFSNTTQVLISNDDNFNEGTWLSVEGFVDQDNVLYGANNEVIKTANIPWELAGVEGEQELFVRFRSASQNVAVTTLSDTVVLDTINGCTGDNGDSSGEETGLQSGMYIKGENFPQVYYLNERLERRPFASEGVYFTHQTSFDVVVEIPDMDLQQYPIGKPMVPKPHHVLIKLPTDPRVYYVDDSLLDSELASIRWIVDENVAEENFGFDWTKYVIDIPIPLFPYFERGADIVGPGNFDKELLIEKIFLTGDMFTNDTDGDGLIDFIELEYGSDATVVDTDGDRLPDNLEVFYLTDPTGVDTDGDGFWDGDEVRDGFNPKGQGAIDSDKDGLTDPMEFAYGTDRYAADSDGDGYDDKTEIDHGFDPLGPGLLPADISGFGFTRYVMSAVDLAVFKLKALIRF